MFLIRKQLSRVAAVVLLLWLFAAGAAFAQACASTAHLLCEECCTEAKAAAPVSESRQDISVQAQQPAPPWLALPADLQFHSPLSQTAHEVNGPDRPPPQLSARIPIVFLRLAL